MGFFGKIKDAFSSKPSGPVDDGIYIHVQLDGTDEVVRIRLSPGQELNLTDDGYISRKSIVGPKSFKKADAAFHFNSSKRLVSAEIDGGQMVDEAVWRAYAQGPVSGEGGAGFG